MPKADYDLFPLHRFRDYRELAAREGYCDPFVPAVGQHYGDGRMPRLLYCGVAARWGDDGQYAGSDEELFEAEAAWSADLLAGGDGASAFWRLLDRILELLGPDLGPDERRARAVWTNLSKSGLGHDATCPPENDPALRALDTAQLRHEIDLLSPDLMVCVSGNNLVPTGVEVFREGRVPVADFKPSVPQTEAWELPEGGRLYWTMHPQFKTKDWSNRVVDDIAALLAGGKR